MRMKMVLTAFLKNLSNFSVISEDLPTPPLFPAAGVSLIPEIDPKRIAAAG